MPYEITWLHEKRVIYERLFGNATLEEAQEISHKVNELLQENSPDGTPTIHLIVNVHDLETLPLPLTQLKSIMIHMKQPALGWTLFVGMKPGGSFFTTLMAQLSRTKIQTFDTVEMAITYLTSIDSTLAHATNPIVTE